MDWIPLFIWTSTGSAILLALLALSRPVHAGAPPPDHPLALPAGLGLRESPLRSWDLLDRAASGIGDPPEPEGLPVASEPQSGESPQADSSPVRLHGIIRTGGGPVYCFLDTSAGRWFRMRAGEQDEASGLLLSREASGELILVQLESGREYNLEGQPLAVETAGRTERNHASDN